MKTIIKTFLVLLVSVSLFNCEDTLEPSALDYIAFGTDKYSTGVDPGGATTFDIPVYTAKVYGAATTFNVTVDGAKAAAGSYDVPASVSIAAGSNEGVLTVSLSDVNLGIGINEITINFKDEAGSYHGESTTLAYVQNCTDITATLDLSFDRWGSEVYWEIRDSLDGLVVSTGGYPDTGAGTTTTDSVAITLCAGRSYTFLALDAYGDGWGGDYTLTIGGVVKFTGDGSTLDTTGVSIDFDTN
jgi:hypothetical protein|tara:strand:- start:168 stop:896 length:729 start_codon:yes stop_codon:yes gene_type:complete